MAVIDSVERKLKNGTSIIIRSAEPEHAAQLTEYVQDIFNTSKFTITQSAEFHSDVRKEEAWINDMKIGDGRILLIALSDGNIIGNIDLNSNSSRQRVLHRGEFGMSTSENFRGLGVGRLLLQELINWTKSEQCPIEKIELGVLSENENAISLYDSMGFTKEGIIRKAAKIGPQDYLDEIRMGLFVK